MPGKSNLSHDNLAEPLPWRRLPTVRSRLRCHHIQRKSIFLLCLGQLGVLVWGGRGKFSSRLGHLRREKVLSNQREETPPNHQEKLICRYTDRFPRCKCNRTPFFSAPPPLSRCESSHMRYGGRGCRASETCLLKNTGPPLLRGFSPFRCEPGAPHEGFIFSQLPISNGHREATIYLKCLLGTLLAYPVLCPGSCTGIVSLARA